MERAMWLAGPFVRPMIHKVGRQTHGDSASGDKAWPHFRSSSRSGCFQPQQARYATGGECFWIDIRSKGMLIKIRDVTC